MTGWATDTYDNNGNTIISFGTNFQYDVMNHLTNATVNGMRFLMTYDGDGNRVSKQVGSTTTYFLVDGINPSGYTQILEEWTNNGTTGLSKVYNYGLNLVSQRQSIISTNYFIYDGHGSTRLLTDIGGRVMCVMAYDAYGNLIASNGVLQTAYLYSSQQYDRDLGLYYNRARYLNSGTGRFSTMDGERYGNNEDPLSLHKYLYVEDNPVNMVDPGGHEGDIATLDFVMAEGEDVGAIDMVGSTVAKKFAISQIDKIGMGIAATLLLMQQIGLGPSDLMQTIQTQTNERSNPTGSPHAYENFECDAFANDAMTYFLEEGKQPQRIVFSAYAGKIRLDEIKAIIGLFSGYVISTSGYHEGVLLDGEVFDNNLPFGVPRDIWEGGYVVSPVDLDRGNYVNLRQAYDRKEGSLSPP